MSSKMFGEEEFEDLEGAGFQEYFNYKFDDATWWEDLEGNVIIKPEDEEQ